MKMVASAKLHKAQAAIESMLPYERRLHHILTDFMSNCTEVTSPFIVKREVKKVAVVVFASNTSLCGGFNANVIRHLVDLLAEYKPLGLENILVFPVGKKVADAVRKLDSALKATSSTWQTNLLIRRLRPGCRFDETLPAWRCG